MVSVVKQILNLNILDQCVCPDIIMEQLRPLSTISQDQDLVGISYTIARWARPDNHKLVQRLEVSTIGGWEKPWFHLGFFVWGGKIVCED